MPRRPHRAAIAGIEPAGRAAHAARRARRPAGTSPTLVIAVSPDSRVGAGDTRSLDRVEEALERASPGTDVVVHVEPVAGEAGAARASAPRRRRPSPQRPRDPQPQRRARSDRHHGALAPPQAPAASSRSTRRTTDRRAGSSARSSRRSRSSARVQTHLEPLAEVERGGRRPRRDRGSVAQAAGGGRARYGCSARRRAWSRSTRSVSTLARRSPRRMPARARSRSGSAPSPPEIADVIVHTEP